MSNQLWPSTQAEFRKHFPSENFFGEIFPSSQSKMSGSKWKEDHLVACRVILSPPNNLDSPLADYDSAEQSFSNDNYQHMETLRLFSEPQLNSETRFALREKGGIWSSFFASLAAVTGVKEDPDQQKIPTTPPNASRQIYPNQMDWTSTGDSSPLTLPKMKPSVDCKSTPPNIEASPLNQESSPSIMEYSPLNCKSSLANAKASPDSPLDFKSFPAIPMATLRCKSSPPKIEASPLNYEPPSSSTGTPTSSELFSSSSFHPSENSQIDEDLHQDRAKPEFVTAVMAVEFVSVVVDLCAEFCAKERAGAEAEAGAIRLVLNPGMTNYKIRTNALDSQCRDDGSIIWQTKSGTKEWTTKLRCAHCILEVKPVVKNWNEEGNQPADDKALLAQQTSELLGVFLTHMSDTGTAAERFASLRNPNFLPHSFFLISVQQTTFRILHVEFTELYLSYLLGETESPDAFLEIQRSKAFHLEKSDDRVRAAELLVKLCLYLNENDSPGN